MEHNEFPRFQEPEEQKIIGIDWQNEPIYAGEEYVETERGAVPFDDIHYFLRTNRLVKIAGEDD